MQTKQNLEYNSKYYNNLTLMEYRGIAQKLITKYYPKFIRDEQCIGEMVYILRTSVDKWNGMGNLYGYISEQVKLALYIYANTNCKKRRRDINFAKTRKNYYITEYQPTEIHHIYNLSPLTDKQKQVLSMIYIDRLTQASVARILGVSREAVRTTVNRGLYNIKQYSNISEHNNPWLIFNKT